VKTDKVETFEDLDVFQRAYRISLEVHRASLSFPTVEQYGLADQVCRASKSICANVAKGLVNKVVRRRSSNDICGWRLA
jgi:four helix bundle protein